MKTRIELTRAAFPPGMPHPTVAARHLAWFACLAIALPGEAAQFEDVTASAGLSNVLGSCTGAAWGDYNNDGRIDLYITIGQGLYANAWYRNEGNGTFTRLGSEAGSITTNRVDSAGCAWVDFNNDGQRDLFVNNGGISSARNSLHWNLGQGTFSRGESPGLTTLSRFRSWPASADYNGDGWVDIFAGESILLLESFTLQLHQASGLGTFQARSLGSTPGVVNSAAWGDYDNDGDPDLYVCNLSAASPLLRNDGHGVFTLAKVKLPTSSGATHAAWGDYDRDGDLDVAISGLGGTVVYRNDGTDGFALAAHLTLAVGCPAWADYDNDGHMDLLAGVGLAQAQKAALYHNNGDGTFSSVSDVFTAAVENWFGPAWGDYDNDGFMDVLMTHMSGRNRLYHNVTNANHWIKFKLTGTASNRDAIGAKVRVQATIGGQSVWQMQEVHGGSASQHDTRPNFGLGDATKVDLVRIEWPSGNVQELADLTPDQILAVNEAANISPVHPTASLNGSVTISRTAVADASYQWRFEGTDLVGQTNRLLTLTNITADMAGRYGVVVSNATTLLTNFVYLAVDTQFTKVTEGPLVTDLGTCSFESTAGDYDGDGYEDLFVPRYQRGLTSLYHNNQDGTFSRVTTAPSQATVDSWSAAAWGDFDNDGALDLLALRDQKASTIHWNDGSGAFTSSPFDTVSAWNVAVADYDRDGRLDLYTSSLSTENRLYRNVGNRMFARQSTAEAGPIAGGSSFGGAVWVDYDDDGWPDLCAPSYLANRIQMHHNLGGGRFQEVNNLVPGSGIACAWADCDNDGWLDVFVAAGGSLSRLYLNAGVGGFTAGSLRFSLGFCNGASWADFDNDGFLDLFVSLGRGNPTAALYHNNGDGSFTRVTVGSIGSDYPKGWQNTGAYWGTWFDYNNDGFLDLHVVNGDDGATVSTSNFLYRNNPNNNAWLKVKLIGTTSNRDGVGAKVRARATYAGASRWQRRDITGGDAINGAQSYAHFGLGTAAKVSTLRIEWPSGTVQEFTDVAVRQFLTVTEPRRPVLALGTVSAARVEGSIQGDPGTAYQVEGSADLSAWEPLGVVTTDAAGTGAWAEANPPAGVPRFYRARSAP